MLPVGDEHRGAAGRGLAEHGRRRHGATGGCSRLVLAEDGLGRHAMRDRVGARRRGLGRPVAGQLAAGHDEVRRDPGMAQLDRVVEPGLEHRRRPPSYWAAPSTTIASAGRARRGRPAPDPPGREAGDEDDAGDGDGRESQDVAAQPPWHFLYFAPDPHQHGSLRPIRAPVGREARARTVACGAPPRRRRAGHGLVAQRLADVRAPAGRRRAGPPATVAVAGDGRLRRRLAVARPPASAAAPAASEALTSGSGRSAAAWSRSRGRSWSRRRGGSGRAAPRTAGTPRGGTR